ncbi:hypothetical protein BDQ17DRAFT_1355575 [Cyathus striatus]|nr:hypothetical protein BDQ17DRAFT_1355575 [Cyathus striatus]
MPSTLHPPSSLFLSHITTSVSSAFHLPAPLLVVVLTIPIPPSSPAAWWTFHHHHLSSNAQRRTPLSPSPCPHGHHHILSLTHPPPYLQQVVISSSRLLPHLCLQRHRSRFDNRHHYIPVPLLTLSPTTSLSSLPSPLSPFLLNILSPQCRREQQCHPKLINTTPLQRLNHMDTVSSRSCFDTAPPPPPAVSSRNDDDS